MSTTLLTLLRHYSWPEWKAHPWRYLSAVMAVALGVALGLAVQLINQTAIGEYQRAANVLDGQADLQVRATAEHMPVGVLDQLWANDAVAVASPVLELASYVETGDLSQPRPADPWLHRLRVNLVGLDVLHFGQISPSALIQSASDATFFEYDPTNDRGGFAWFSPDAVFANEAAWAKLKAQASPRKTVQIYLGDRLVSLRIAGVIAMPGGPALAMDVGALQQLAQLPHSISRVDVRLKEGVDVTRFQREFALPAGSKFSHSGSRADRAQAGSRAYRANLTALALVALFVGAYLVFSVVSLSVAKRLPQWALLGVMGLDARQRFQLLLLESATVGAAGSILGLLFGLGLANFALSQLGGDLGGGYFGGRALGLAWNLESLGWLALYGGLGIGAACVGAAFPALQLAQMPLATALRAQGWVREGQGRGPWVGALMMALGAAACLAPPVAGLSIGAYTGIALLLFGGIAVLPPFLGLAAQWLMPQAAQHPVLSLALARAWRVPQASAAAVSGVVAALALAVALIVMVASFRTSVERWLDVMLPAPLYLRSAGGSSGFLSDEALAALTSAPGVERSVQVRNLSLALQPDLPSVGLLAVDQSGLRLDWVAGSPISAERLLPGEIPIYASEGMLSLHGARLGEPFPLDLHTDLKRNSPSADVFSTSVATNGIATPSLRVMGVWRDYGRQHGSVAMRLSDYRALTGDFRVSDLYIWPREGMALSALRKELAQRLGALPSQPAVDFTSSERIRELSLQAFDRSFAVTTWLQAVAIGLGLFGVAASFSAQVLARRKEFGLLAHLGFTRAQIHRLLALEGAVWTTLGALAGLALGLVIAVVLVHVVNPQSFHWTMDLNLPWVRILTLLGTVLVAGTVTTVLAGRAAASAQAVMAVKEDW